MDNGLGNAGAFFMVRRGNGWHRSSPCFVFGCARHWAAPRQKPNGFGYALDLHQWSPLAASLECHDV